MAHTHHDGNSANSASDWSSGFEAVMAMQRPALEAIAAINTRFIEQVQEANATWSTFVQSRLKEDMAMPRQLAGCQTIQDMVRVCSEFMQRAAEQYQAEFAEMTRIGQTFTSQTAAIMREKAEEASRELKH
jgi:hypothetical protein